ncbi:gfo/Idh/MocA family oxidoreductase [Stappia sp. GBMRC 2046]|uniref:Gfo/Idh/MocA family oxidoreductase n=1 Tax=Stappia sediminis TaxID=2692190 RepID=A0A7X3S6V7_9HYPH|nr:Gfo/Idh/MocA family oxidoreductase [Stappia sediminis]MXN64215.1 gfo/Idh/MocA family oxidoreductase [Stappia sediminis]
MTATETPVAIVGLGKIAVDQHVPSIAASPAFRLGAVISRHASMKGVPCYSSLGDMLAKEPDIPAVALCVPPQVRFDLAHEALSKGRNVLLEKPPGASLSEVEALSDLAKSNGCVLFATWHSRFAKGVPRAKEWLANREIGKVMITWREDVRHWHPGQQWIWQPGGLGVFDPGINALSILTEILPAPVQMTAAELEFPENRDTPIAARLSMRGSGKLAVEADFDWRQTGPQTWNIEVETDRGLLRLTGGGAHLEIDSRDVTDAEALQSEYDGIYGRFADLLREGRSEVDVSPLRHVADALMLGKRLVAAPFND